MLSMLAASDDTLVVVNLIVGVVFGAICSLIANGRGRSAVGWFFIGLFTNCIGLVLVLVLPDVKQEEERRRRLQLENRRLKEQLNMERQVSDRRHHQIERRLGVHDAALGLDTAPPPELPARVREDYDDDDPDRQWHYAEGQTTRGPVLRARILELRKKGMIDDDTLVWTEGMAQWTPLGRVGTFGGGAS
jgi:hypothetical protein